MTILIELIKQYAGDLAARSEWRDVEAALNLPQIPRKQPTTSLKRFVTEFGSDTVETVLTVWSESELGKSLRSQLEIVGLDFTDPYILELIDRLDQASKFGIGIAEKLKSLGVITLTPWQNAGLPQAPTAEEIQAVWEPYALRQSLEAVADEAYATFVTRYNAAKSGIDDGTLTTTEQVTAVLAGGA